MHFNKLTRLGFVLLASTAIVPVATAAPKALVQQLPSVPGNFNGRAFAMDANASTAVGYVYDGGGQVYSAYWSADGVMHRLNLATTSQAFDISGDGSTILLFDYGVNARGSVFKNGVQTFLPHFIDPTAGQEALAINHDGSVVVGFDDGADGESHAMMWSGTNWGTVTDLGLLATGSGNYSYARAVDAIGATVAGVGTSADAGRPHAFYWQNGTIHDIGQVGFQSQANGISADGTTIVG